MNEAFYQALRESRTKRVDLTTLRKLWVHNRPELISHPNRDSLLLAALKSGADLGLLRLPSARSFERFGNPPMPTFITVATTTAPVERFDWSSVSWRPELGFWMHLKESEKVTAKAINDWLIRRKGKFMTVPLRERSLDIFGHEKHLDSRVPAGTNALFGGRLPLSAIGARKIDYPLPYRPQPGASEQTVLIVENHHTFFSLAEWNMQSKRYAAVVYGSGAAITASGMALDEAMREVGAVDAEYFGDIDPEGLSIPQRYNKTHSTQLMPSLWLYEKLMAVGRTRSLDAPYAGDCELLASWIPELSMEICRMWEGNLCLPQEGFGLEQLMADW